MSRPALGDASLLPGLEPDCYFDHAAIGPLALPVREAMAELADSQGRSGVGAVSSWLEARDLAKRRFGALVGVQPEDVAFTTSTSAGITAIATCLDWRPGDRVLLLSGEFPANITPWQRAAELHGLRVRMEPVEPFAEDPHAALGALLPALEDCRLLALSAVQFQTGLVMPVAALCEAAHARGAQVFVDGIQGCGVRPLDVGAIGVDYYAVGGHKWLGGPLGTGMLAVRPDRWSVLRPHLASWLSHEEGMRFLFEGEGHLRYDRPFRAGPALFEGSAFNAVGAAGLAAALGLLLELGVPEIHRHVQGLLDPLEQRLLELGFRSARCADAARRSGSLSVRPPSPWTVPLLAERLRKAGVAVSTPDGWLRFAPHWHNRVEQVDRVLAAVERICADPPS